jgi:TRAP transporter TAXI family solute receptor
MSEQQREAEPVPRSRRSFLQAVGATSAGLLLASVAAACSPREFARARGAKLRLSVATGGTGGVYYPYGGGIAKVISESIPNTEATAEVTSASVDNLKFIAGGTTDLALTLADTLKDAYEGEGTFEKFGRVPARALAVLYTNYTHVVTLADKSINRIADLRGRVVSTGSPGSGTETIAFRVLEAAGIRPNADIQKQGLGAAPSVDAIKDGKIDAFFWSGGVPTGAILDLANTPGRTLKLLPQSDILPALQQRYGAALYYEIVIPRAAYSGLEADVPVVGVANLLVVDERMSESLAYEIIKVLFDKKADLVAIHSEAKNLELQTATVGSPVPFHPGAIRFYQEKGVWKG